MRKFIRNPFLLVTNLMLMTRIKNHLFFFLFSIFFSQWLMITKSLFVASAWNTLYTIRMHKNYGSFRSYCVSGFYCLSVSPWSANDQLMSNLFQWDFYIFFSLFPSHSRTYLFFCVHLYWTKKIEIRRKCV